MILIGKKHKIFKNLNNRYVRALLPVHLIHTIDRSKMGKLSFFKEMYTTEIKKGYNSLHPLYTLTVITIIILST